MSQVIDILTSLGIDGTVFYQFAIFFVAFFSMNIIVFKPYLAAYKKRLDRTVLGQEATSDLLAEVEKKEKEFQDEARSLNHEIKDIFDEANGRAKKEVEKILIDARKQADQKVEEERKNLNEAVIEARKELETHVPSISKSISERFVRS